MQPRKQRKLLGSRASGRRAHSETKSNTGEDLFSKFCLSASSSAFGVF